MAARIRVTCGGLLSLAFMTAVGCGSGNGAMSGAPTADLWGEEVQPTIGVRTYFVLDDRLESKVFQTPRAYPREEGPAAPLRLRTGLGMKRSIENRMAHTFRNHGFARTMGEARAGLPEQGKAELIVWPRLIEAEVEDGEATVTASVVLSVLVTTAMGAPVDRITLRVRNTAAVRQSNSDEDTDPNLTRLNHALTGAFNQVMAELGERLPASPSLSAIISGTTKTLKTRVAVDYSAAVACARQQHVSAEVVDVEYGRDDPEVRRQLDLVVASFGDDERLATHLLACQAEGADLKGILDQRLSAIQAAIDRGDFAAAQELLAPLEFAAAKQKQVKRMSSRLSNAIRERREAEDRERLMAEAEVREKAEADARRIEEEEERLQAQAEAEREAAERVRRQAEADKLGKTARAKLARRRYEEARSDAIQALKILPNHVEAMTVLQALQEHDRDVERQRRAAEERRRQQELATLQRQVPQLIEKCNEMRKRFQKAEQKEQEAAVGGNPAKAQKMFEARMKAGRDFNDARNKVQMAIDAYRQQGLAKAADAVYQSARHSCGL